METQKFSDKVRDFERQGYRRAIAIKKAARAFPTLYNEFRQRGERLQTFERTTPRRFQFV